MDAEKNIAKLLLNAQAVDDATQTTSDAAVYTGTDAVANDAIYQTTLL